MDEYKPNSHKYKAEQKQLEGKEIKKVVTGKVQTRKKNEISKFTGAIISEDAANVKSYILSDVLIPAVKKLISDIVKDGIEMMLYGTTGGNRSSTRGRVDYSRISRDRRDDRGNRDYRSSWLDYDDISFEYRSDADAVLQQMQDVIDSYGFVTVADMFDMAEMTAPYTANKYGWTSIRNAEPVRTRDGSYVIKLPRAIPIG